MSASGKSSYVKILNSNALSPGETSIDKPEGVVENITSLLSDLIPDVCKQAGLFKITYEKKSDNNFTISLCTDRSIYNSLISILAPYQDKNAFQGLSENSDDSDEESDDLWHITMNVDDSLKQTLKDMLPFQKEKIINNIAKLNYTKLQSEGNISIGLCEVQGKRSEQEDFLKSIILPDFSNMSVEQQNIVMAHTFTDMQNQYGVSAKAKTQGSTGCVATAWLNENNVAYIHTTNLGDSIALLVIVKSNEVLVHQLNKILHHPDQEIALAASGNPAYKHRGADTIKTDNRGTRLDAGLACRLELSRAFGDLDFEKAGLIHTPDMYFDKCVLSDGEKAFIVVACDGLVESMGLNDIQDIIQVNRNHIHEPQVLAQALICAAVNSGSNDNVSAAVFPIINKIAVSAAIFDGHMGSDISFGIGENFYPALQKNIRIMLENKSVAQAAPSSSNVRP